jgi:hypothetical protein
VIDRLPQVASKVREECYCVCKGVCVCMYVCVLDRESVCVWERRLEGGSAFVRVR